MSKLLLSASLAVNLAVAGAGAVFVSHHYSTVTPPETEIVKCRKALRGEASAVMILCYQQSFISLNELNDWQARMKAANAQ